MNKKETFSIAHRSSSPWHMLERDGKSEDQFWYKLVLSPSADCMILHRILATRKHLSFRDFEYLFLPWWRVNFIVLFMFLLWYVLCSSLPLPKSVIATSFKHQFLFDDDYGVDVAKQRSPWLIYPCVRLLESI